MQHLVLPKILLGEFSNSEVLNKNDLITINNKITRIPGIVKRQESQNEKLLELGLSFPIKQNGVRVRRIIKIEKKIL